MKNKPQKHKSANAFKHKSFADRLSEIDVRKAILYHIDYRFEEDLDENESYFASAVAKWRALNLTDEYEEFHRSVREIVTLPQLLHKKDFIIEHLLSCLAKATHLSLQPLLEFVAILAKELQSDFCIVLDKFLGQLLIFLQSKDSDIVEWTLICLAYLFKHLKKHLKKEIGIVLNLILPILTEDQSEHIQNFAIECFSYVARDIRDRQQFLATVVDFVRRNDGVAVSCGRLLFQIVRGVGGGFHSCTEEFLIALMSVFHEKQDDQEIIYQLIDNMIDSMLNCIKVDHIEVFWTVMLRHLQKILTLELKSVFFIQLLGKVVHFRSGLFVKNAQELSTAAVKLLEKNSDEMMLLEITSLAGGLLTGSNINLPLHEATNLARNFLSKTEFPIFEYFVKKTVKSSQFDSLILPHFMGAFSRFELNKKSLRLLAMVIIIKSPPCQDGLHFSSWKSYEIPLKSTKILDGIEEILMNRFQDEEIFNLALVTWTQGSGIDRNRVEDKLTEYMKEENLENNYLIILQSLLHVRSSKINPEEIIERRFLEIWEKSKEAHRHFEEKIDILRMIDLCVTFLKLQDPSRLTFNLFGKIHKHLSPLLSSPSHQIRLLTSHALSQFDHLKEFSSSGEMFLFQLIFTVENTPSSVTTDRNQLRLLQKISHGTLYFKESIESVDLLKWDGLRYLLGVLFINFKRIWEPVLEYIASYALNADRKIFWEIYKQQMENVEENLRQTDESSGGFSEYLNNFIPEVKELEVEKDNKVLVNLKDKPDFINYRILLWKALSQFGDLQQEKNRDLVGYFLEFYEKVYKVYVHEHSYGKIDLRVQETELEVKEEKDSDQMEVEEENHEEASEDENSDEEEAIAEEESPLEENEDLPDDQEDEKIDPQVNRAIHKELITYLQLFSSMPNPKFIFRSNEMHSIYLELLSSRNPEVQKNALDCLYAYKPKNLQNFREILFKFIEEKTFREALNGFVINLEQKEQELSLVGENRPTVMEYLLRILWGKMYTRQRQEKGASQVRKIMIIRYLSGCSLEEINKFLDFVFRKTSSDPEIEIEVDLGSVMHPRYLQSCLTLLDVMLSEFGGVPDTGILSRLLYLILEYSAIIQGVLSVSGGRSIRFLNLFKNLRTSSGNLIRKFFNLFEGYPWREDEIEQVFEVFIWPQIDKLPVECIHSPTPLLRLLLAWSTNPRYFILFGKENKSENPLKNVVNLLQRPKINAKVTDAVMEIISNLLSLEREAQIEEEGDRAAPDISVKNVQIPKSDLPDGISLGRRLILPYIDIIIHRLQNRFSLQRKAKSLGKRDLSILSRITDLVTDQAKCDVLVGLLLPILTQKTARMMNESAIIQMITSLTHLVEKSRSPEKHIRTLAPLFEEITSLSCRKLLCELIVKIARGSGQDTVSEIVQELNALNRRWIDQPDFDRRLAAFRMIEDLTEKDKIDVNAGLLAIFHAFFFLRHEKDLAIRSSSSHCLRKVTLALAKRFSNDAGEKKYLFDGVLLPLIKRFISGNNESLRIECVRILGDLSRDHPHLHYVFTDLHVLTEKQDKEVDFFENIIHLQSHRQGRALARFIKLSAEMKDPNPKSLLDFILPLASAYLCSEKFTSKNALVDSAAEAISVICKKLPFIPYQNILRMYIRKLRTNVEYQKQMVKVVIAIIDAFHFDFTGQKEKSEYNTLLGLITSLIGTISEFSTKETNHKLTKSQNAAQKEEEDILRVPIAVATVQLLHKVSKELLDTHLSKILMKMGTFLRSRLKSVRIVTRDMLRRIMMILGPGYLKILIDLLTSLLTRGYQVHVLVVTLHNILDALKGNFKANEIDDNLQGLLRVCLENVFGESAEEREVLKIASKTHEAKVSNKSFLILQILAANINEKCLLDLLLPFKDHLAKSHSKKITNKVQDCLARIVTGLGENKRISTESLLIFAFGVISESIDTLKLKTAKKEMSETDREMMKRKPGDIYLIVNEKTASKKNVVKTNVQTNTHILIEFGLNLLHTILKSGKADSSHFESFLTPLVKIFQDTLGGVQVRLSTLTLKCLTVIWTRQLIQEALKGKTTDSFVCKILEILKRYSSTELTKNDENFHLIKNAFKAVMALMRFVEDFVVTEDHLREILHHIDRDLHARQAIAFPLLRAIVAKKLYVKEIDQIIEFVAELCVTSESDSVREEARQILITYLLDYPLDGGKFKQHLMFFLSQLAYSESTGRDSVVKLFQNLIKKLSKKTLKKNCGVIFLALGARFVEDELPEIREDIAKCIEGILRRLDVEARRELWEIVMSLFKDKKTAHVEMGAILSVRFMQSEGDTFWKRLDTLLPLMVQKLTSRDEVDVPGKFVRAHADAIDEEEDSLNVQDHKLIQILIALGKIFEKFPKIFQEDKFFAILDSLAYKCQELLGYEHSWVRYFSAKILTSIINVIDVDLLVKRLKNPDENEELPREFLYRNPENEIRSLTLDLCAQLQPEHVQENMTQEISKIMLTLAKFVKDVAIVKREKDMEEEEDMKLDRRINLLWIIRRLRYAANGEVTQAPHITVIRMNVFQWIQGVVHLLDPATLRLVAKSLLTPLLREMSTEINNHDVGLSQAATKIVEKIKKKLNSDAEFESLINEIQLKQMQKRSERKKIIALEKVMNPARVAKRKAGQQERKKVAKKRKMDIIKGKVAPKKRKTPPNAPSLAKQKRKKSLAHSLFALHFLPPWLQPERKLDPTAIGAW
ncbi:small subunit processome component 20 homolog [Sergentomyia squamirostris]